MTSPFVVLPLKRPPQGLSADLAGPLAAFVMVMLIFSLATPRFLSSATFGSVAFQLP